MSLSWAECAPAAIGLSLQVVFAMIACQLIFGVALAWLLSRPRLPGRLIWESLISLPLVFPPIAIGFFLLLLLGRRGTFGRVLHDSMGIDVVFSPLGVYLAALIAGLPLIVKPVQAAMQSSAGELAEAAYVLGRGRFATFFLVVLPSVHATILAGLVLAIGRALGEVGITLMLGGNIVGQTETLSLAIYNRVLDGDFDCAMQLSLLLGCGSLVLFGLMQWLGGARSLRV